MLQRFISNFFTVLLIAQLAACSDKEQSYFPINNSKSWQYRVSITTMDGSREQKYLLRSLPAVELENEIVFPRQTADGTTLIYNITDEGIFRIASVSNQGKTIDQPPQTVFKFPLEPGTTWQQETTTFLLEKTGPPQRTLFKIQEPVLLEYQITSINDVVKVPAGRFTNCLRIEAQGNVNSNVGNYVGKINITIRQTLWYAPEPGLIKSTRTEHTNSTALDKGEYILELEKL